MSLTPQPKRTSAQAWMNFSLSLPPSRPMRNTLPGSSAEEPLVERVAAKPAFARSWKAARLLLPEATPLPNVSTLSVQQHGLRIAM